MTDAFDADVLIYAAMPASVLGPPVAALFALAAEQGVQAGLGSVVLLPEVLSKPLRAGSAEELRLLSDLLAQIELLPCDVAVAELAATLGARHRLRAADAVHLATAVQAGADRFITNNRSDFPQTIEEIQIVYPEDLLAG